VDYTIKLGQLWIPKYGTCQARTIGVDSETVRLSGLRVQMLFAIMIFPCALGINDFMGLLLGFNVKKIPLIIICSIILLILYFRWKPLLSAPVLVEKRLLTNIQRSHKNISLCLPNPEGMDKQPVKVTLQAINEDEAMKLENELRS
jgi:hypothetical protein